MVGCKESTHRCIIDRRHPLQIVLGFCRQLIRDEEQVVSRCNAFSQIAGESAGHVHQRPALGVRCKVMDRLQNINYNIILADVGVFNVLAALCCPVPCRQHQLL
ncbi:hypothetical protein BCR43DRAFT_487160 [Syncephalastrum racemosum]|uniref:Uncharacterized protein n=1 Tax=Syncephalastrum racemosum TaxID=13706 RepID=A0A1X2HQL3_SYNRA|nr:hypothetical protein BCR43DRAFT_487160 [Syncephalastrum racemosum]